MFMCGNKFVVSYRLLPFPAGCGKPSNKFVYIVLNGEKFFGGKSILLSIYFDVTTVLLGENT